MAEPKTEIDRRLDRIEKALGAIVVCLVQAKTGFTLKDADEIDKILRGEDNAAQE